MTVVQTFPIRGLATVTLDTVDPDQPNLVIRLDPDYVGDLNDIALKTEGPDDVFLQCDRITARGHALLMKFMEVLEHWDHTGPDGKPDGVPDCDDIMLAIDEALCDTDEQPMRFHRPSGSRFVDLCMSFMPPTPNRHIAFSFGDLKPRFRWYHHVAALPMLAIFIALMQLQYLLLPVMKYSVVTGIMTFVDDVLKLPFLVALVAFYAVYKLVFSHRTASRRSISPYTYGFFSRAALDEEQTWREGAEGWTTWQRIRSCFSFGLVHQANLIYPLATILPLALGGGLFMLVYLRAYRRTQRRRGDTTKNNIWHRRAAVLEASVWHRVYNRMALIALAVSLVVWLGLEALSLFGVMALINGIDQLSVRVRKPQRASAGQPIADSA